MDIRKIEHAMVLASELNFSRAAEKCHLSQSALSQSIARLEEEMGLRLFERNRSRVKLTQAGILFLDRSRKLLHEARNLRDEMSLVRSHKLGMVTLGLGPFPAGHLAKSLISYLANSHPKLVAFIKIGNWEMLFDHLINERIEFFLAAKEGIKPHRLLTTQDIGKFRNCFYVKAAHPLLALKRIHFSALQQYPIFSATIPEGDYTGLKSLFGINQREPLPISVQCDDIASLKHATMASNGILFSSEKSVLNECMEGKLVELKFHTPFLSQEQIISIATLTDRPLSPGAEIVVDFLRNFEERERH